MLLGLAGAALGPAEETFTDVRICALCHLQITAPEHSKVPGEVVGPSALWPGTMMAHSARDPYWLAKVRLERAATPALREVIEDTCLSCHAPAQQFDKRRAGARMALADLDLLGEQGVECIVCHRIERERLGAKASFTAGFKISESPTCYGPHREPFARPMEMHSGYTPVHGGHIVEASLCATCHTVITPTLAEDGTVKGEFIEQAPFLEWLVSDYGGTGMTCQTCHLPPLEDRLGEPVEQYIAHNPMGFWFPPTSPRQPFGRHVLAGSNVTMLGILASLHPDEKETLAETRRQTQSLLDQALTLTVAGRAAADLITTRVEVTNNAGHKLPTGFPSRRLWLRFAISDADGRTIFESGAWDDSTGEIQGLARLEPHHARITEPSQVMIYEAEMADSTGSPTLTLLRASGYAKDNRLLPRGFDLAKPLPKGIDPAAIRPSGAGQDPSFAPGMHTVTYEVPLRRARGPYTVMVEALFQSQKPSHVSVLPDREFRELWNRHGAPVRIAQATTVIPNRSSAKATPAQ